MRTKQTAILVFIVAAPLMYQNCSRFESTTEFNSKSSVVSRRVFPAVKNVQEDEAVGMILADGGKTGQP